MVRAHALIAAALVLIASGCNCGREKLGRSGVCAPGDTQSCGHEAIGECHPGTQTCTYDDAWGPCEGAVEPVAESCDGKDNDCNGTVDDFPDGGTLVQSCYDGPAGTKGVGLCQPGTQFCQNGGWGVCDGQVMPVAEICNGEDDDCDGAVDNQPDSGAALVQACYDGPDGTRGVGACSDGSQSCMGGAWTACAGSVVPAPESCNAVDDDCNGQVDDAIAPLDCYDGPSGTLGVGTCRGGFRMCSDGGFGACTGEVTPVAQDVCDGLDESCDGRVNGGCPCAPGSSIVCYSGPTGTQGVGACRAGVQLCGADGGYQSCTGDVTPSAELCNGQDDDCDGTPDNQPGSSAPLSQACYDGAAGTEGVGVCRGGTQTCQASSWSACANEVVPSSEICDGRDNDCNGSPDNGNPGGGASCTINGLKGPCAAGVLACADGGIVCVQTTFPTTESCNGQDDDCDGTPDDFPDGGTIEVSCYDGGAGTMGVGVCRAGVSICTGGAFAACTGEVMPGSESCNGLDDDCNGAPDDAIDAGSSCTVAGKLGPCAAGTPVCSGAAGITCQQTVFPQVESCDGSDLNCDGIAGDFPDGGAIKQSCYDFAAGTAGVGICRAGTQTCSGSSFGACVGEVGPTAETCNGLDDDCDGTPDDGVDAGSTCTVSGKLGPCAAGKPVCSGAAGITCQQTVFPQVESCDGSDLNCDGIAGDFPDGGRITQSCYDFASATAGVGVCKRGTQTCGGSSFGSCAGEVGPTAETCNGKDDDCDGTPDDGIDAGSTCTVSGKLGLCAAGKPVCSGASGITCQQTVFPTVETCDGRDSNCDGRAGDFPDGGSITQGCYDFASGTAGVGICKSGTQTCTGSSYGACAGEVGPSAEVCNGLDDDCNGTPDNGIDAGSSCTVSGKLGLCAAGKPVCSGASGITCQQTVFPTVETCDGRDSNCDGRPGDYPDGGALTRSCYDLGSGTPGVGICKSGTQTCSGSSYGACAGEVGPTTETCNGNDDDCNGTPDDGIDAGSTCAVAGQLGDCASGKPVCSGAAGITCQQTVFPSSETCNGNDQDCDGTPDDFSDGGPLRQSCWTGPAGDRNVGTCRDGTQVCSGGAFGSCSGQVLPTTETCNGLDDDCNGTPDNGIDAGSTCSVAGKLGPCAAGKPICSGAAGITCQQLVFPSVESCNGTDSNCDGRAGDYPDGGAITQTCYDFGSGTPGQGPCKSGVQTCSGSGFGACAGEVGPSTEVCNGVDDNCNGTPDDGVDAGSGSCATGLFGPCATGHYACGADGGQVCVQDFTGTAPDNDLDGYDSCSDCNDNNAAVHPGATEKCDGIDNDCDTFIDEGFDSDKDCYTTCGTGYASFSKLADGGCDRTATVDGGSIDLSKVDCDDTNANVHPDIPCDCGTYNAATGTCGTTPNGVDDNCNSEPDETCACLNVDADRDGYTDCEGDCDDSDKNVHPGAAEVCDGKDDDCNPLTTDNCDVGEPCNFDGGAGQPSPDQCKSRYICATDVSTGVSSCGDLCNYSETGAGVGDGCLAGTVCGANLIASDNDHVCVPSTGSGTRTAGSSCTSNSQCRSNSCNGGICTDLCGNDGYCGSALCTVADFAPSAGLSYTEVYGGYCQASQGTAGQDQSCGGAGRNAVYCKWGTLSCFRSSGAASTTCHQICCKQSDCPSGDYCGQGPSKYLFASLTINGTAYPVDTGVPACLPRLSGQGRRTAGQACTSSSQCASDLCDSSGVCLDYCCNDSSCPTGLTCEFVNLEKSDGHVQQARLCVAQPTQSLYSAAP